MIYPLPESLSDTHDGDEWAIAAILGGRVVALRYISDIAPGVPLRPLAIKDWLQHDEHLLHEMRGLGSLGVGLVNSDGFQLRWLTDPVHGNVREPGQT